MRRSLLCLFLFTTAPLVRGEAPFRFESTPGKLPKEVVPVEYRLHLVPDVEHRTFTGMETVDLEIKQATNRCVLNASNLEIQAATLTRDGAPDLHPAVVLDAAQQTCTLTFPQELPAGSYHLSLGFSGQINQDGAGLYASTYDTGGHPETMLCTEMEPADARRLFPCWDEPSFRARFSVSVRLPKEGWTAVSNMPVKHGDGGECEFEITPSMPSYLVVLALGDFATLEGEADGIKIRVVAPKDRIQNGRYALESAQTILHYYDEYFGFKFPLPKLDLIAVSGGGGFGGAMENWGGIVFSENSLLYDPAVSSQATKERIFEVTAHEMAHQWFGDLVTMAWWDNLWLNEGFAEWMGQSAADRFNPGWEYWQSIATNKDHAMGSDARSTTHPIQEPVVTEADSVRAFDEITYNKGQAFIRMLEGYVGPERFRDGVRRYMQAHAYGNTTTADLWAALDSVSEHPVGALAAQWTEQPGFPLVSVSQDPDKPGELRLTQRRFTVHDPHAVPLRWQIPVTYLAVGSGERGSLLLGESATVPAPASGAPLKFNAGNAGYYRVAYDEATLRPLLGRVNDLPAPDQNNLLNDAWAAVRADLGPVTNYLGIVRALRPTETNPLVWTQVCGVAGTVDRLYADGDPAARARWRQAMAAVLRPVLDHYGWQSAPREGTPVTALRTTLIQTLGLFADPATVDECKKRFAAFLQDPGALPPDIREPVCNVVGRFADAATYEAMLAQAGRTSSDEQRLLFYGALSAAADPALARRTLELIVRDDLPSSYLPALLAGVAYDAEQPAAAVRFALDHMDKIQAKVNPMAKNLLIPAMYSAFNDAARADELESYAKQPGAAADPTQVKKYAETIRSNADLKTRLLPEIDRWAADK